LRRRGREQARPTSQRTEKGKPNGAKPTFTKGGKPGVIWLEGEKGEESSGQPPPSSPRKAKKNLGRRRGKEGKALQERKISEGKGREKEKERSHLSFRTEGSKKKRGSTQRARKKKKKKAHLLLQNGKKKKRRVASSSPSYH